MHNEKMADSRDMIGVHDAMRREFGALPALIAGESADLIGPAELAVVRYLGDVPGISSFCPRKQQCGDG